MDSKGIRLKVSRWDRYEGSKPKQRMDLRYQGAEKFAEFSEKRTADWRSRKDSSDSTAMTFEYVMGEQVHLAPLTEGAL